MHAYYRSTATQNCYQVDGLPMMSTHAYLFGVHMPRSSQRLAYVCIFRQNVFFYFFFLFETIARVHVSTCHYLHMFGLELVSTRTSEGKQEGNTLSPY